MFFFFFGGGGGGGGVGWYGRYCHNFLHEGDSTCTCSISLLLVCIHMYLDDKVLPKGGSTLKGKNLLLEEQIHSLKGCHPSRRKANIKLKHLPPPKV